VDATKTGMQFGFYKNGAGTGLWKTTTNQNQRQGAEDRALSGPITNKMKGTFQKQCKGHSMGATTFLVHAVIWLMTRSMCDA